MGSYSLAGKTALVTGAARGIGLATAQQLVARGANVVLVDLHAEAVEAVAASVHAGRALGIAADVTDAAAMQAVVEQAVARFGGLDVVVANAGIAPTPGTVLATTPAAFERVLEVNAQGVYRTVHAGLPHIAARGGHVVVVASIYAFANGLGSAAYAMSKAAVEQFGRALRVELAPRGASASVAYFGFIDTAMVHDTIDADPRSDRMMSAVPKALHKRLPPRAAGEAIVRGIEGRRARIVRPRRWVVLSVLRGIVSPLSDAAMLRDPRVQSLVREFDARDDEQTPTTT